MKKKSKILNEIGKDINYLPLYVFYFGKDYSPLTKEDTSKMIEIKDHNTRQFYQMSLHKQIIIINESRDKNSEYIS